MPGAVPDLWSEMNSYEVINVISGHSFGVYQADSAQDAIKAMLDDAGASDQEPDEGVIAVLYGNA
jgi:hypothetical protein